MRKIAIAFVAMVLAALLAAGCNGVAGEQSSVPRTSAIAPPSSTGVPDVPPGPPDPLALTTVTTSKSIGGLALSLAISSTYLESGQAIAITIDEQNTRSDKVQLSAAADWPLKGLTLGP